MKNVLHYRKYLFSYGQKYAYFLAGKISKIAEAFGLKAASSKFQIVCNEKDAY